MRVLIADDNAIGRRILESMLGRWGWEVVSAANGDEAWSALQRDDAPRLAILDWMMPGMDGLAVCRAVRDRGGPHTHIILLTGRDEEEDIGQAMEAGADEYLTKPVSEAALRERVARAAEELGIA